MSSQEPPPQSSVLSLEEVKEDWPKWTENELRDQSPRISRCPEVAPRRRWVACSLDCVCHRECPTSLDRETLKV